jgi:hypothetical protein
MAKRIVVDLSIERSAGTVVHQLAVCDGHGSRQSEHRRYHKLRRKQNCAAISLARISSDKQTLGSAFLRCGLRDTGHHDPASLPRGAPGR